MVPNFPMKEIQFIPGSQIRNEQVIVNRIPYMEIIPPISKVVKVSF